MILFDNQVETICADITAVDCDAVVNAANSSLMGGGGVDGAIHWAAGPVLLDECRTIRRDQYPDGLPPGEAVMTGAGDMRCSRVIHTVGPVWNGGGAEKEKLLSSCYRKSLALAEKEKLRTVAFPAISTGVYGYPPDKAALVVYKTLKSELPNLKLVKKIYLVFFTTEGEDQFLQAVRAVSERQN